MVGSSHCIICNLVDLPSSDKLDSKKEPKKKGRKTRSSSGFETEWMLCSLCEGWLHPACNGINNKEYIKIKELSDRDSSYYFKCICCCILEAVDSERNKEIVDIFKEAIKHAITRKIKRLRLPKQRDTAR